MSCRTETMAQVVASTSSHPEQPALVVHLLGDTPSSGIIAKIDNAAAAPPRIHVFTPFLECSTAYIKHSVIAWLLKDFFPAYDTHAAADRESTTKTVRPRAQSADYFSLQAHVKKEKGGKEFVARLMPVEKDKAITIKIDFDSFKKKHRQLDAKHTKDCLRKCINKLNAADIGIRFMYVPPDQAANFTIAYAPRPPNTPPGSRGATIARSFPPGDGNKVIFIFEYAFSEAKRYDNLTGFLCHELGHTLGMRHSTAEETESDLPSVRFPPTSPNEPSMMEHHTGLTIHNMDLTALDIEELKAFYTLEEGVFIGRYQLKNYPPSAPN